ncbi:lipoxygenase family protein [Massilia sp. W12]|uniref:lipoxygenase family protein n=1 Tax=Massilia sp. W12 TaxID=3126507 RepID=UPI0030D3B3B7
MFDLPRSKPLLPQDSNPAQQQERQEALAKQRDTYLWSREIPNVVGVPMAAKVPLHDDPTLEWLVKVGGSAFAILENALANLAHLLAHDEKEAVEEELSKLRSAMQEHHKRHEKDGAGLLAGAAQALRTLIAPSQGALQGQWQRLQEIQQRFAEQQDGQPHSLQAYQDLFRTIAVPEIAQDTLDDRIFSRMRVAGPNPMLLSALDAWPEKFRLSEAEFAQGSGGDNLQDALREGRLFWEDYAELESLTHAPVEVDGKKKTVFAPMVLFVLPKNEKELLPVAIQCGQDGRKFPTFIASRVPQDPLYWGWQFAKSIVQVAATNYHELFAHLARTHLVMEAFTVATHRELAPEHPINLLLLPHCEGSLFINSLAASSLIAPGGAIDHIFGAKIEELQKSAGGDRLAFDFTQNMLPADLRRRGLDDVARLPYFPYRDDALLVWGAIEEWCRNYVWLYYADEAALRDDCELSAWSKSLQEDGLLKGFSAPRNREELAEVLTMAIFTASAQHAAVNFPQFDLEIYSPLFTGAAWADLPAQQAGLNMQDWLQVLPDLKIAFEQLNILYLLGSVYYRKLGEYKSNHFPYPNWLHDPEVQPLLEAFQQRLQEVEAEINLRNTQRHPYPYLLPSRIPASINI